MLKTLRKNSVKRFFYVAITCIFSGSIPLFSQNLVPNGDFELGPDTSSAGWQWKIDSTCGSSDYMAGPDFWVVTQGSPDRWLEGNVWCLAYDTAQSGKAFIYLATYEGGKTTLRTPLQKDSTYKLSYYAYYDSTTYGNNMPPPSFFVIRFNNNIDSFISPLFFSAKWQYYDTIFTASGNATEIELLGLYNGFGSSATNIDNIKLEKIGLTSLNNVGFKEFVKIYPNPTKNKIFIKQNAYNEKINSIAIYNVLGEFIYNATPKTNDNTEIDLSQFPNGLYTIKIISDVQMAFIKFLLLK